MSDEPDDTVRFSLLMPFVVVASKGGPYDDPSFTAGYRMGQADETLRMARAIGAEEIMVTYVKIECEPQLELLAMRYGFALKRTFADGPSGMAHYLAVLVEDAV